MVYYIDFLFYFIQMYFSEMFRLMSATLVILFGNSEAERVFSCQNRIKTKHRKCLTIEHLDWLIRVSFAGPEVEVFNFAKARDVYLSVPRRL
jgi:hypothetical protein